MTHSAVAGFEHFPFRVESFSTQEILAWPGEDQEILKEELSALFPRIFLSEKDWRYVVRHYFFDPAPRTRHGLFIRDRESRLVGTACLDVGAVRFGAGEKCAAYVHIRAILPEIQIRGLGQAMARWMLAFEPDYLFTTCMQPLSLYSWIRLVEAEKSGVYEIWPYRERDGTIRVLPPWLLGEALSLFTGIYSGHVKEDSRRVEAVVQDLTVRFVRRGVGMVFERDPWSFPERDPLAEGLGLRESDGILLVLRRQSG